MQTSRGVSPFRAALTIEGLFRMRDVHDSARKLLAPCHAVRLDPSHVFLSEGACNPFRITRNRHFMSGNHDRKASDSIGLAYSFPRVFVIPSESQESATYAWQSRQKVTICLAPRNVWSAGAASSVRVSVHVHQHHPVMYVSTW